MVELVGHVLLELEGLDRKEGQEVHDLMVERFNHAQTEEQVAHDLMEQVILELMVEQAVHVRFRTPSGAAGEASWDFDAAAAEDLLLIDGAKGTMALPQLMNGDTITLSLGGDPRATPTTTFRYRPPAVVQRPFVRSAIDAIRAGDSARCPSTAASALRTEAIIDAVLAPYYGGRADAFWERPQTWPGGAGYGTLGAV